MQQTSSDSGHYGRAEEPATSGMLYAGYDREGLEYQYSLRPRYPERETVYAALAAASAELREATPGPFNVQYGDSELETLDVFPAVGAGNRERAPVLIFFHGGYWRAGDKDGISIIAKPFMEAGMAVVMGNYQLAPAVTLDTIVSQARRLVAWVAGNCEAFGGDPARIAVAGHSAGGHLTAMCVLHDWSRLGLTKPVIRCGVPISGLFDLEPLRHTSVNDEVRLDAAMAHRNSPRHLARPCPVPLLMLAGDDETEQFRGQSTGFAETWSSHGNPCQVELPAGYNHFTILEPLADSSSALHRRVLEFLQAHLS